MLEFFFKVYSDSDKEHTNSQRLIQGLAQRWVQTSTRTEVSGSSDLFGVVSDRPN